MATPQIGDEFAGYRIEALLGRGGMGVVYRAEQQRPHRRVALKLLAAELSADPSFRERFIRESDLAAAIEHPNIIPIYDAGEVEGQLYIAMRYVQGSDLKNLVEREGRLDPARALALISQVGSALDVAHSRGLVHRDVKPHNILIASGEGPESSDHVYLTDFGLTKHAASRTGLTAAGHFVGTIDYVAPEQIEGKQIDSRTDVYSLGCVLFECLTGRLPYERDTEVSVMYAHISDTPPSVRALRAEMPPGLDAVIARALAKTPAERFATCRELVVAAREELGIVSGERAQTVGSPGGAAAAAGAAGVAAGAGFAGAAQRPGETVHDAPAAATGDPSAGPRAQQGGWQTGQQGGQGGWQDPGQQSPAPGWQQGPPGGTQGDPGWQGPPGGGGGGWGGPPPGGGGPGGPGGPGWGEEPPRGGPNKGLLFGIIGGLVLIALVVGAFLFLGGDDGGDDPDPGGSPTVAESPTEEATPTPGTSPTEGETPTDETFPAAGEEEFLYVRIPTEIQPTCERQTPDLMPNGATVGITCTTGGGADFVSYYKYPTLPAMDRQYDLSVSIANATQDTGSCPTDIPSETTYERADGEIVGRLVCYDFQGAGRIEWTNNKLLVYSEAVSLNGMSQKLYNFWTTAGPNTKPSQ